MKNSITFLGLMLISLTGMAASSDIVCHGDAEYGTIQIKNLVVNNQTILLQYSLNDETELTKTYITTEYMIHNGRTDLNKTASMIGGTQSGQKNDYEDISLPHFGLYKAGGLGSEIAFNHKGERVFGIVNCEQK